MTREEAIELNKETCCHMSDELIHAIYNSFESRTCESCKHLDVDTGKSYYYCDELHTLSIGKETAKDFCCKYYERREDVKQNTK